MFEFGSGDHVIVHIPYPVAELDAWDEQDRVAAGLGVDPARRDLGSSMCAEIYEETSDIQRLVIGRQLAAEPGYSGIGK